MAMELQFLGNWHCHLPVESTFSELPVLVQRNPDLIGSLHKKGLPTCQPSDLKS